MPKVKIEDLTNEQLDHFCAIAQGWFASEDGRWWDKKESTERYAIRFYHPTTNAAQCMEIMEREKWAVMFDRNIDLWVSTRSELYKFDEATGVTAKQAIIRCFIKSKLGDEVGCESI